MPPTRGLVGTGCGAPRVHATDAHETGAHSRSMTITTDCMLTRSPLHDRSPHDGHDPQDFASPDAPSRQGGVLARPQTNDVLRLAVGAYLGRYKGQARVHTGSDLKVFTTWSTERGLDPLDPHQVGRPQVEAFVG